MCVCVCGNVSKLMLHFSGPNAEIMCNSWPDENTPKTQNQVGVYFPLWKTLKASVFPDTPKNTTLRRVTQQFATISFSYWKTHQRNTKGLQFQLARNSVI